MKSLNDRLSRLEGQLRSLKLKIESGEDCSKVIPQFLAVKGALNAGFEEYIKSSLGDCALDQKKMNKLIKILTRK